MNNLLKNIDCKILLNEPLSKHTTFGIGGPVLALYYPDNEKQLITIIQHSKNNNIPFYFLGSGSNVLVSDTGFKGVIISLKKTFKKFEIQNENNVIYVQTGVMLGTMVRKLTSNNIEGYESLIGVPGTVGGAIYMNAGAFGQEISTKLLSLRTVNQLGMIKKYYREELSFSYRYSNIPIDEIIIDASFKYNYGDKNNITVRKKQSSIKRKESQPLKFRSAGSIFKNPSREKAAGYLIEKSGLKGLKVGNAVISNKHANFILNIGGASSNDVMELINIIKSKVYKRFNVNLELEIKLLGFNND